MRDRHTNRETMGPTAWPSLPLLRGYRRLKTGHLSEGVAA